MALVSDVISEAQVLLNDSTGVRYTSALLLPIFKKVYRELQRKMIRSNVPVSKEISSAITVNAGTVALPIGTGGGGAGELPQDLLLPIKLEERAVGDTLYTDMRELDWEPDEAQQTTLDVWVWREQEVKLRGATVNRQIRVYYIKSLTVITAASDTIKIADSEQYLASKVAAVAAFAQGANPTRAAALQSDAENDLDELMAYHTKRLQGLRIRRKGFRRPRYYRYN